MKPVYLFTHRFLCVYMFLFLLGRPQQVEALGHVLKWMFNFERHWRTFSRWLYHFAFSSAICRVLVVLHSCMTQYCQSWILAILLGVWWCLMRFWLAFSWWLVVLNILSYTCLPSYIFVEVSIQIACKFLIELFIFLLSCKNSLCNLNSTSPLSDMCKNGDLPWLWRKELDLCYLSQSLESPTSRAQTAPLWGFLWLVQAKLRARFSTRKVYSSRYIYPHMW